MNLSIVKSKLIAGLLGDDRELPCTRRAIEVPRVWSTRAAAAEQIENSVELHPLIKAALSASRIAALLFHATVGTAYRYVTRHPFHTIFNCAIAVGVFSLVVTGSQLHQQSILSKISSGTIDNIIAASSFNRPYAIDGSKKNGVREFVMSGAPRWAQAESVKAILFEARKAGLGIEDQATLLAIANIESGFNPLAQAQTTSACGLFQFVEKTGEAFNLRAADCMDPMLNSRAGVRHYISNYNQRVRDLVGGMSGAERVFKTFELSYYVHHDGINSSNPSNDVKAIVINGSEFLFKAYHVLQNEAELQTHAPTFGETFFENTLRTLNSIGESVGISSVVSAQFARAETEHADVPA